MNQVLDFLGRNAQRGLNGLGRLNRGANTLFDAAANNPILSAIGGDEGILANRRNMVEKQAREAAMAEMFGNDPAMATLSRSYPELAIGEHLRRGAVADDRSYQEGQLAGERDFIRDRDATQYGQEAELMRERFRLEEDAKRQRLAGWTDLPSAEAEALGFPRGAVVQRGPEGELVNRYDVREGVFSAAEQRSYRDSARSFNTILGELDVYKDAITDPAMDGRGLPAWENDADASALATMHANLVNTINKANENGVLNEGDMDNINRLLPQPVAFWRMPGAKERYIEKIDQVRAIMQRRLNMLPSEFQSFGVETGDVEAGFTGRLSGALGLPEQTQDPNAPPPGVPPELWEVMTPEERAAWRTN